MRGLGPMAEGKGSRQVLTARQGAQKPFSPCCWAPQGEWDEKDVSVSCVLWERPPDTLQLSGDFPSGENEVAFSPPCLSKSVVAAEIESFSFSSSAPRRRCQRGCHILPAPALGRSTALRRGFRSPRSPLRCGLPHS